MADVTDVGHIHTPPVILLNHESQFNAALWILALSPSPEKHGRVHLTRVFGSHVIILETQTAPWVAFLHFVKENAGPVSAQ